MKFFIIKVFIFIFKYCFLNMYMINYKHQYLLILKPPFFV